jgi:16S rRNA processing protein RimM
VNAAGDLVTVAHIRRSRGNKGEVIADSLSSHPERFEKLTQVWLRKGSELRQAVIESAWMFRGAEPVLKFAEVDSIGDAEKLAGYDVCVPVEERVQLEEGEYFFSDIVGCEAFDGETRCGEFVGWQENESGQIWFEVLEDTPGKEQQERTFLVPFHRSIFREIDVVGKRVRLDLPEGLRDLNHRNAED